MSVGETIYYTNFAVGGYVCGGSIGRVRRTAFVQIERFAKFRSCEKSTLGTSNAKHSDAVTVNREDNAKDIGTFAEQELTNFNLNLPILSR